MKLPGRNTRTGLMLSLIVVGMVGMSFAAVPLYRLFCQVTGYGGTTQVASELPAEIGERRITVRFNADVDDRLNWDFAPTQREVALRVGEPGLAFYRAKNLSDVPVVGTATFNVTPLKAGSYFSKVQCFCFTQQRLEAGEEMDMAVSFFVDPAISEDPNLDEVKTITLSYTFFEDPKAAEAARREMADAGGQPRIVGGSVQEKILNEAMSKATTPN